MSDNTASQRQSIVLLAIFVEGGLILVAWSVGWLLDRSPLERFQWNLSHALWGVAAAIPLLVMFLVTIRWPFGPLRRLKWFTERVICPLLAPCTVMDLLGISILAGLGEEMLFRGVLQGWMSHRLGPWQGVILASILFGIMHAVTLVYAVLATCMGAYLGWLWLETDNLLVPVVAHAVYDFVVLLYLLRGPGSGERTTVEEEREDATEETAEAQTPDGES
jgi:membrane protease YdiL (CAAX protease family)